VKTKEKISVFQLWTFCKYSAPAFEVYVSQLIWYFRPCVSYYDFIDRVLVLTAKLPIGNVEVITSKVLQSPLRLG
jgi:hypothetical protein